jgi:hypothetical protein
MNNGGTTATGYLGINNTSGTRCTYTDAMANSDTYMTTMNEALV